MFDPSKRRTCEQVMLKIFNALFASFCKQFHGAIVKVLHVTENLMPRRCSQSKISIPNALDFSADQKFSRNGFRFYHSRPEICVSTELASPRYPRCNSDNRRNGQH